MRNKEFDFLSLNHLCDLMNGYAFKPDDWSTYGTPIIRIQNLNASKEYNYFRKWVPDRYYVEAEDLLFSWPGNRGTSFGPYIWAGPRGLLNQHIFKVAPKKSVNKKWLFYALHIAQEKAEQQAHGGSGLVHVKREELLSYRIPTPSEKEQRRITEILDTIDESIQKTEALIEKLKAMKQGLLHDLLNRGLDENGKLRDRKAHPEQFKDSVLGKIPKTWCHERLSDLTDKIVDGVHSTPKYKSSGIPFLTVENLTGGENIDFDKVRYISERDHRLFSLRADPRPGDLLVTKDGTLGVARTIPDGCPSFSIFVSLALLRPKKSKVIPSWVKLFFDTQEFRRQLGTLSAGTGLKHIHLEHFKEFLLCTPKKEEQERIFARISSLERSIEPEIRQLSAITRVTKGLMHDLLTGKVRVKADFPKEKTPS